MLGVWGEGALGGAARGEKHQESSWGGRGGFCWFGAVFKGLKSKGEGKKNQLAGA